jgi:hypothetical protein
MLDQLKKTELKEFEFETNLKVDPRGSSSSITRVPHLFST